VKYADPQKKHHQWMYIQTKRKYHWALVIQFLSFFSAGLSILWIEFVGSHVFCIGLAVILGVGTENTAFLCAGPRVK